MQYFLRLKKNDLSIWGMDWGLKLDQIRYLMKRIEELTVIKIIEEEEEDPLLKLRNSLHNGKLSLRHGVANYQFYKAFFGGHLPMKELPVKLVEPLNGCSTPENLAELKDAIAVVSRGDCSFIDKANNVSLAGPGALLYLNSDNQLFRVSAGHITNSKEDPNENTGIEFGVGLVTHEATGVLKAALDAQEEVFGQLVPVQCKGAAECAPILPEEKEVVPYVDSGYLAGDGLDEIEFLTSTFGMPLPTQALPLLQPSNPQGCEALSAPEGGDVSDFAGAWVLVARGGCPFGDKAKHAQDAGARGIVIMDNGDAPLARFATNREDVFIPGLMVTKAAGEGLIDWLGTVAEAKVEVVPSPGAAQAWLDLAALEWPEEKAQINLFKKRQLKEHGDSPDRQAWIKAKAKEVLAAAAA
uniref:PA domain-containing protein n=2 Tax=Phaeomonas parva TaxID=124430 RepID=A0A7S1UBY5_9STRA|mmetsp:Transcript_4050/g.11830  ORF Transcript_4050/g.11830 Transcript_4050/m.11830 type:complete len:412 (+) Transcript_4050:214-1449(+)